MFTLIKDYPEVQSLILEESYPGQRARNADEMINVTHRIESQSR